MLYKLFLIIFPILIFSKNAYAYLDPGLGSIIIQGIIASVAATSLTIKIYSQKIKDVFQKNKKKKKDYK